MMDKDSGLVSGSGVHPPTGIITHGSRNPKCGNIFDLDVDLKDEFITDRYTAKSRLASGGIVKDGIDLGDRSGLDGCDGFVFLLKGDDPNGIE